MSVPFDEFEALEARVTIVEDLTGPDGRLDVLAANLAGFRAETAKNFLDVGADITTLKDDMARVNGTLAEILDRLPPKAA